MIATLIIHLLLQTVTVAPRAALENPAVASPVPRNLQKDYDKLWQRFRKGTEDDKVVRDTDKLLKKNPSVISLTILEAYMDLYAKRTQPAETKFEDVLKKAPENKIALSYLSDFAFNRQEYGRAYELYSRLLEVDPSRTDVEPKRQKALLLAIQSFIGDAAVAEKSNRLDEAESLYGRALQLAPREPSLHERLGELYAKQKKWENAIAEFQKAEDFGGASDETDRQTAEALVNLGRADEARAILDRLKKSGSSDEGLEKKLSELEDIGRWGNDISMFRAIQAASAISRAQTAILLVRYFPQLTDMSERPPIMTDVRDAANFSDIQVAVGSGVMDLRPNRRFEPAAPITRGEFAAALGRLIDRLGIATSSALPVPLADVAPTNTRYREVQAVLADGLMSLDDSGNFNVTGTVSGDEAVHATMRLLELSRKY